MIRQQRPLIALLVSLATVSVASGQIFTDDLSTGDNWTIAQDSDSAATFGYDYSQDGLPPAPGGSDTIGLKFEVNNNEPADVAEIVAVHENDDFTGQYTFRVDIWSNWALDGGTVGAGTTEFTGVAVGHDAFAPGPYGATFIYSGDGDAADTDYRLYKETVQIQSETGQYALGTEAGARDHSNPILMEAFPEIDVAAAIPDQGQTGTGRAGTTGFQWMTVNMEVDTESVGPSELTTDPGFARVSMQSVSSGNTVEIGTIDNSNNSDPLEPTTVFEGSIALLMSDIISSITVNPAYSFGIFDNVQVLDGLVPLETTPEGLVGDYNEDDIVNAADYVIWRNHEGTSFDLPNRDPGASGDVGPDDYTAWVANFGATTIEAGGASSAVPEPGSFALLVLAAGSVGHLVRFGGTRPRS